MNEAFHPGELDVQRHTGEAEIAARNRALITTLIPKGAIRFVEQQQIAIFASKDPKGRMWTSLLVGQQGFVSVPEPDRIIFDTRRIISDPQDVFYKNIANNAQVGSLFIDLNTRKRLRVNGTAELDGALIRFNVHHAYPNCPRYIQKRLIEQPDYFEPVHASITEGSGLSDEGVSWISSADTCYVSSVSAAGQLDASHRGGLPGFIEVTDSGLLKIPDYNGNSMFNTFGNFLQDPAAGMLFIDYENGRTLQLAGTASLLFDQQSEADLQRTKGTGRYWLFKPVSWIRTEDHHRVHWRLLEYSPFNS